MQESAAAGMDVFRIFDSLNWVPNMRVAMDAVLESVRLCEAAICYTGDILDPQRDQVRPEVLRRAGQRTGKDGCPSAGHQGHGRPVQTLRGRKTGQDAPQQEIGIPIHFHTHDTSGVQAARCSRRRKPTSILSIWPWLRCRA